MKKKQKQANLSDTPGTINGVMAIALLKLPVVQIVINIFTINDCNYFTHIYAFFYYRYILYQTSSHIKKKKIRVSAPLSFSTSGINVTQCMMGNIVGLVGLLGVRYILSIFVENQYSLTHSVTQDRTQTALQHGVAPVQYTYCM